MKTGAPTRLADKLNADLNSLRQEHLDLIDTQLTSFKRDLTTTVTSARDTIESDFHMFQQRMSAAALRNAISAEQMFRLSPWTVTFCVLTMILALMAATVLWHWAVTSMQMTAQMQNLGLQMISAEGATWLIPNPDLTTLHTCKMAGQPVTCIRVEN